MKKAMAILFLICIFAMPVFAQGYCKSFCVRSVSSEPNEVEVFAVSPSEQFVVLTVYVSGSGDWSLVANSNFSISGCITNSFERYSFPDTIAVINATEPLLLTYDTCGNYLTITVVGYYEDVVAPETLISDLNNDGKVNWADFSILANQWLE